ncbi:MAG: DUF424 domain-containing protein [Candidatus Aenigmatarchaeota archaeon]
MFYHSFTKREGQKVLAVCDKKLLGKVLEDEERSFEVKESFYGDETIDDKELLKKAEDSTIINAIGSDVVSLLIQNGFFEKDKVLKIDGVEHAQMARI